MLIRFVVSLSSHESNQPIQSFLSFCEVLATNEDSFEELKYHRKTRRQQAVTYFLEILDRQNIIRPMANTMPTINSSYFLT